MENRFILSLIAGILHVCMCNGQNEFHPLVGNSKSDIVLVEQSPGNDRELFPDTYSVWFYHDNEPIYIDLSRDDSMTESLSPSLFQASKFLPNELMTEKNKNEFAYYHNNQALDSDKRAHFVLHRPDITRPANVYGQLNHEGYMYILQSTGNSNQHRIRREISLVEHRAKRASTEYIVEVVVWIAPDLFQYQKARLGATNSETSAWFETYRPALIRDIDLTFQKVSTLNLRIQYVGGGVTQSESTSWFADNYKNPYLADQDTLSDVTTFLQSKIGGVIPSYDHAIVITRADLAKNTNGDKNERQAAATGSICADSSGSSVSIAEVSGPFYRKLVAQAIGLGFGLKYEFGSDIYRVMARDNPSFPVPDNSKDEIFSFGSSRDTLLSDTITSFGTQCLTSNDSGQDFNTFINGDKIGTTYTNDEQCAILYGAGSTVCSGDTEPSETCYSEVKCEVSGSCSSNIILGQESVCDAAKSLGCFYSACTYNRGGSSSSSSSSSSSTSSTAATTTSTKAATSTTTSSTTSISTSTTVSTSTQSSSMLPSSSPSPDCCCERRPLGEVKINIEYIPCPNGNPDNKFIVD